MSRSLQWQCKHFFEATIGAAAAGAVVGMKAEVQGDQYQALHIMKTSIVPELQIIPQQQHKHL